MIIRLKNNAGPTSRQASMISSVRLRDPSLRSMCLCAFSIITIAASTMAPIEMAMPPKLMMLEFIPKARMAINAISTPTGSITMATSALRAWNRNTRHTRATIRLSSSSVVRNVLIARSIRSERS